MDGPEDGEAEAGVTGRMGRSRSGEGLTVKMDESVCGDP